MDSTHEPSVSLDTGKNTGALVQYRGCTITRHSTTFASVNGSEVSTTYHTEIDDTGGPRALMGPSLDDLKGQIDAVLRAQ